MIFNVDSNFSDVKLVLEKCLLSYVVRSPTLSYTWNSIAACVVNIIFAIAGTILNSLVLYIFWKSTKMRSKFSYFGIMLLSSADLAVVTIVHWTFLLQAINEINGTPNCVCKASYTSTLYLFTGMSISTLLILNIERYTAIIHPIWHRKTATKRRLIFIWITLWLLNILNVVSRMFLPRLSKIIVAIVIFVLCFTTLFTYISIFRVVNKKKSFTPCNTVGHSTSRANCQSEETRNIAAFLRELKMAKVYFAIVVLAFVCFLPAGIGLHALKYPWNKSEKERSSVTIAYTWTNTLITMNSTLNCLIFFWANRKLRREALKLVKRFSSKENISRTPEIMG